MLQPKRTKFRKAHKGRIHGNAKGGYELNFGAYGLKAQEPARVTARQIEAARRAMTRHMKRAGRVWIRMFPDLPVSKKPTEVRMGKGKGSVEYWAPASSPAGSCLKWTVCRVRLHRKHSAWLRPNCRSRRALWRASANKQPRCSGLLRT
jgi:large subunit ribosomal protein L16